MASFVPPCAFYTFDGGFVTMNEGGAFECKCYDVHARSIDIPCNAWI